jgi:hypothetical protein
MSPESLVDREYSELSDVYMFGITLWELFARQEPHKDLPPLQAAMEVVSPQKRLRPALSQLPPVCPQEMKDLMQRCWSHHKRSRPAMKAVVEEIERVMEALASSARRGADEDEGGRM